MSYERRGIMRKHLPWLAERLTFELVEAAKAAGVSE